MSDLLNLENKFLNKNVTRDNILEFENYLKQSKEVFIGDSDNCPLKHSFCDGFYVREIFIPKGHYIVGKIHKHSHPNFLMKGRVLIATEDGVEELVAPLSIISKAGTKRALYIIEDCTWVTIHENPNNTQDLSELEKHIIAKDYDEYDNFANKIEQKLNNKLNGKNN